MPVGSLELPVGSLRQRPPAYSAVKVGGRRAYQLARAGVDVELAERDIDVYRFEQRWHDGERRGFVVECSSGTYVRSLIADLGDAYCESLRRTAIGAFDVAQADPERRVGLQTALAFMPEVALDAECAARAGHGAMVPGQAPGEAIVRLTGPDGLIALAEPGPTPGTLKPIVGLRSGTAAPG